MLKLPAATVCRIRWRWLHTERLDDWLAHSADRAYGWLGQAAPRWFDWFLDREGEIADWIDLHIVKHICAHEAERDHCGIPAHDLCRGCGIGMPNMAPRSLKAMHEALCAAQSALGDRARAGVDVDRVPHWVATIGNVLAMIERQQQGGTDRG